MDDASTAVTDFVGCLSRAICAAKAGESMATQVANVRGLLSRALSGPSYTIIRTRGGDATDSSVYHNQSNVTVVTDLDHDEGILFTVTFANGLADLFDPDVFIKGGVVIIGQTEGRVTSLVYTFVPTH